MIIVQIRENSSRWPNKWKADITGIKLIDRVYQACEQTDMRPIVFAVPDKDKQIIEHCIMNRYEAYACDSAENDLVGRFIEVMHAFQIEKCLRVTGDCGFLFPEHLEWVWKHGQDSDFCTACWPENRCVIDGNDCEVISLRLLRWMDDKVNNWFTGQTAAKYKEHIPTMIYNHQSMIEQAGFYLKKLQMPINLSHIKTSLDIPEDLERMKKEGLI